MTLGYRNRRPECDRMAHVGTCSEDGCDQDAIARRLCSPHYARHRKAGTLPPKLQRPTTCTEDGCPGKVRARGLCDAHYQRRRKRRGYKPPPLPMCTTDGCDVEQWAKGLCGKHYQRQRLSSIKDPCSAEGCEAPGIVNGMCPAHHHRQYRYGDPSAGAARRYRNRLCLVDECERRHEGLGLCRVHYRRFANTGSLDRSVPHSGVQAGQRLVEQGDLARSHLLKRDGYTCQLCDARDVPLHADHVKPWSLHPELRFDLENGRALCVPCHMKTPTWGAGSWRSRQQVTV